MNRLFRALLLMAAVAAGCDKAQSEPPTTERGAAKNPASERADAPDEPEARADATVELRVLGMT
jgi:hypothetical protein